MYGPTPSLKEHPASTATANRPQTNPSARD